MANQVAARLKGDDYQHLYGWYEALALMRPGCKVRRVRIEDADAGSIDDVTVRHESGTSTPNRFYQIKYHVRQQGQYDAEKLTEHEDGSASLLLKFWITWRKLRDEDAGRTLELFLLSNWPWDAASKIKTDGESGQITEDFFTATAKSALGKAREQWRAHLQADAGEFENFARCLRFKLGDPTLGLKDRIAERMENLRLRSEETDLIVATGIVREWVKQGRGDIALADLEAALGRHNLFLPPDAEQCVTVYLSTIKDQRFDMPPDHILDWRGFFEGSPVKKGHTVIDEACWNETMLPQLAELETRINHETDCRLVHARGLARLSAWFAFGYTFSEVARYTIEVDQQGLRWRTDAPPSDDFTVTITSAGGTTDGEPLGGSGTTVAVGISVTGSLDEDVRAHLSCRTGKVAALLLVRPNRDLGRSALQGAGDAAALAESVKNVTRTFVKHWKATRLVIYYFGPLSGACFIGHKLNAVCRQIQIMEDQQPGYAPSFTLE